MIAKKKRILIMSISITIGVLLLLGITYGIIYYATDLLRGNKELFYKYASQNKIANIIDVNWIRRYEEKNNSSPYQSKGKVTFKQESSDKQNNSNDDLLNNLNLELEGKANLSESLQDQTVKLNYNNNEILRLDYLRTRDVYGVKMNDVIDKYAAFQNSNLKDFLKKMEFQEYEDIPNKVDPLSLTEVLDLISTNKDKVKKELIEIIDSEIETSKYKKEKKVEINIDDNSYITNRYFVELTDVQVSNIERKVLEFVRDDEEMLDAVILLAKGKSKENADTYKMKETIERKISELKRKESTNEVVLTLSVYVEKSKLVALGVKYKDNDITISDMNQNEVIIERKRLDSEDEYMSKIKITKNINDEKYQLTYSDKEQLNGNDASKTVLKLDLSNDLESNSVENRITFSSDIRGDKLDVTYVDRKNYVSDLDILQFSDDNSQKINDFSKEDNERLLAAISSRVVEVFEEKMKSIGIEVKMTDIVQEYNEKLEAQKKKEEDEKKASEYTGDETKLNIDQITTFNKPYEDASKAKMKGQEYKDFLEDVLKKNKENPENQQVKVYIQSVSKKDPVSEEQFEEYISKIDTDVENRNTYTVKIDYSQGTKLVNKLELK